LQVGCPSCCTTNGVKALKSVSTEGNSVNIVLIHISFSAAFEIVRWETAMPVNNFASAVEQSFISFQGACV